MKEARPGKNLQIDDRSRSAGGRRAGDGRARWARSWRSIRAMARFWRWSAGRHSIRTNSPCGFSRRIGRASTSDPDNPLLNRAIQAQLAPGSTFKPLMALAGLETGAIDDQFTVHCAGGASFYGHFYHCLAKHGAVSLHRGIIESCNSYFYNVGNRLGIDKIAFYGDLAGFGHKTGIDLPNEAEGIMPSPQWKIRNFRQKWYAGETTIGFDRPGRADHHAAATGARDRRHRHGRRLVQAAPGKGARNRHRGNGRSIRRIVQKVIDGMYGVVNEGGTGVRARIPALEVCGKTGSAQVASNEFVKAHKQEEELKDNGWFVGFAQRNNPEIVVAVLFQGGEHGALAAPIVRDVIKAYYDKKARLGLKTTPGVPRTARPAEDPRRSGSDSGHHGRMTGALLLFPRSGLGAGDHRHRDQRAGRAADLSAPLTIRNGRAPGGSRSSSSSSG